MKEKKRIIVYLSKYFSSYFSKIWEDDRIILYFLFLVLNKYLKFKLYNLCSSHRHISGIAVLKNKKVILDLGKNLLLYNLEIKQQESFLDIKVWTLRELSNGDIACGLCNGLLYIIKVTDELLNKTQFSKGHKTTINCIIELENNKIVTSYDNNDLIMWDPKDPESMYFIKGHTDVVTSLCFIYGTKFSSTSRDKTLKIWE